MNTLYIDTPIGALLLRAENGAVTEIRAASTQAAKGENVEDLRHVGSVTLSPPVFAALTGRQIHPPRRGGQEGGAAEDAVLQAAAEQLGEYFAGKRQGFDFPMNPRGTAFQKRVWAALGEIPYGETRTYAQLARAIGSPGAARAAGSAAGRNPIMIAIPCHRLVAAKTIGGFAYGTQMKRELLKLEGVLFP